MHAIGFGAAALAVLGIGVASTTTRVVERSDPPTTDVRGTPAIGVYIRRGEAVRLWDGTSTIAAGDALRMSIVGDGYRFVAVYGVDASGRWGVLYRGEVDPDDETVLPPAWVVDARGNQETLVVVLDEHPIDDAVPRSLEDANRGGRWVRRLVLPKSTVGTSEEAR